jgi:hypothetical protein
MTSMRRLVCSVLLLAGSASSNLMADDTVVRVEEDWKFKVLNPAYPSAAPQIANVISPVNHLDGQFMILEVNRATQGEYAPGGLQLQAWQGDSVVRIPSTSVLTVLRYDNEIVTYTISMETRGEKLRVEVINGHSMSWGDFGDDGDLLVESPTTLTDLSGYSPELSVLNAAVEIGAHRVKEFALTEVRFYSSGDEVVNTIRPNQSVHEYQQQIEFQSFPAYTETTDNNLVKTSAGTLEPIPTE